MMGKIIVGVLAVVLISYFVFFHHSSSPSTISPTPTMSQPAVSPTVSPTVASSIGRGGLASRPVDAANAFYIAYGECMFKPPAAAAGQVSVYCQTHNPYGTDSLAANLEAGGIAKAGADPITCSQNPPSEVKMGDVTTGEGGVTTVTVQEKYGTGTQDIKVDVELINNEWKVTNIHCPIPQ